MNALNVVVADDHSLTLQGVSDSLLSHGISVVGRGKTAAGRGLARLTSISMPRTSGVW
ncbi:MAG: hypothetical protein NWP37_01680 [Pontimonas sp.]|nr:hypothetical protein [Pontimonas sp.]